MEGVLFISASGMAVTTLRQILHTEIDASVKSDLLSALGGSPKCVRLGPFGY